jgi:hypothetical protein
VTGEPVLIAAFEGWNDAANAASDALRALLRMADASPVRELDAEAYFDFQAARPQVEIVQGVVRAVRWPATTISVGRVGDRTVVLALGVEPNLHWPAFCREIIGVAREHEVGLAVTLGALLGDTPHTRPVMVTGTASDPRTAARLDLARSRYEGPTGIVGVLADVARREGLPSVSLWAPVPHYVASPPNPKATLALLDRIRDLLDLPLDLANLSIAARAWQEQVDSVAESDDDLVRYVRNLEDRYDTGGGDDEHDLDLVDPDEVAFDDDLDWDDWSDEDWDAEDDDDNDEADEDDDSDDDVEDDPQDELPSGDSLADDFERYLREQDDDEQ